MATKRDWSALGWATVWFLVAGLTIYQGFEHRQESKSFHRTASNTTGVVTYADPGFQSQDEAEPASISYKFIVDGKEYTGDSQDYVPVGDPVEIRYAPDDPTMNMSVDHNENHATNMLLPLLFGGAGVFLFLNGYCAGTAKLVLKENFNEFEPTPISRFFLVISGTTASYLLFNEYIASAHDASIYARIFVFLAWLQIAILAYLWDKKIICFAYLGLAIVFNPLVIIHNDSDAWAMTGRIIAIINMFTIINLKPLKTES